MDEQLTRYLHTVSVLADGQRWFESPTAMRVAALHLAVRDAPADAATVRHVGSEIRRAVPRVDPLRPFAGSMAALSLATNRTVEETLSSLASVMGAFEEAVPRLGKTDRARAVPCLVFHSDHTNAGEAAARVGEIHRAWNRRHRWMTTGRHVSFAAMAVAAGVDSEQSVESAAAIHDLLNGRGVWHEWDASILLSFGSGTAGEAVERYEAVAAGFTDGSRKPPAAARDDLAFVALAPGSAEQHGATMAGYVQRLRELRPRPSLQVALAVAATLVVASGRPDGHPNATALIDGFALYSYAEALREESPD